MCDALVVVIVDVDVQVSELPSHARFVMEDGQPRPYLAREIRPPREERVIFELAVSRPGSGSEMKMCSRESAS